MKDILYSFIQPLRGWKVISVQYPPFHVGLLRLNPFRICKEDHGIPASKIDKNPLFSQSHFQSLSVPVQVDFFTTKKPTGKGTCLGLSLSYDIVKAHGGELKLKTMKNEGLPAGQTRTEFTITLPIDL